MDQSKNRARVLIVDDVPDTVEIIKKLLEYEGYEAFTAYTGEEGVKIGSLKIRLFRPFPFQDVFEVLSRAKKVAVIDRNISFGHHGIFFQEVKSALYGRTDIPVIGYIAGIGGRDVTPKVIREIAEKVIHDKNPEREINWIGVKL